MTLEEAHEIELYRQSKLEALQWKWNSEETLSDIRECLALLDDALNYPTSSIGPMKLYSSVIDYSATGEGQTAIFLASREIDKGHMLLETIRKCGHYYTIGADIYEGLPPKTNSVVQFLVSPSLWESLKEEIDADQNGVTGGYVDILLKSHYNFS